MSIVGTFCNRDLPEDVLRWVATIEEDTHQEILRRLMKAPPSIFLRLREVTTKWKYLNATDTLKKVFLTEVDKSHFCKTYGPRGGLKSVKRTDPKTQGTHQNRRTQ